MFHRDSWYNNIIQINDESGVFMATNYQNKFQKDYENLVLEVED